MEALYVCLFSNSHIKVGRSISPESRIASHADRVACMGVSLIEHHIVYVKDSPDTREAELIAACTAMCSARFLDEWFAGLDYEQACKWADSCAVNEALQSAQKQTRWTKLIADLRRAGWTQNALAIECGCGAATISRLALGQQTEPMFSTGERLLALYSACESVNSRIENVKPTPASTRGTLIEQGA